MKKKIDKENVDAVPDNGKVYEETSESPNSKTDAPYVALRKGTKHRKPPSLLRTIIRCFGCYYALTGICKLAADIISFTSPQILRLV